MVPIHEGTNLIARFSLISMARSQPVPIIRAVATARLAADFLEAARAQPFDELRFSMVTYFLLGHALELAFKSLLIARGTSESILRKIGHDLAEAAAAAKDAYSSGYVELSASDMARLELFGPLYQVKAFEYVEPGRMTLPSVQELLELTDRVVENSRQVVDNHVRASLECQSSGSSGCRSTLNNTTKGR